MPDTNNWMIMDQMSISQPHVCGWKNAIRGARSSYNSEGQMDSIIDPNTNQIVKLGNKDFALLNRLAHGDGSERKFLRLLAVYTDISAPFYFWKQFDTYKVGTVALSQSTMHTLMKFDIEFNDFSTKNILEASEDIGKIEPLGSNFLSSIFATYVGQLNAVREYYNSLADDLPENSRKKHHIEMAINAMLPQGYLQKRTIKLNYEVCLRMYHDRKNHKLDEWQLMCSWIEQLPYFEDICLKTPVLE